MQHCLDPYPIYSAGSDRRFDALSNKVDGKSVACGRCKKCVANRKQAWTGKLVAEALSSESVTFLTLTYSEEHYPGNGVFPYEQIQGFLYRLRVHLKRKHNGTLVRFFCIGEEGNRTGRVHWHLLLFFDQPYVYPVPERKQLGQFWPFGWSDVQNVRGDDAIRAARYVAKYAVKNVGQPGQRPRMSLKPALGHAWLQNHAHETAKAGLCPNGKYSLPGMVWARGPKKGQGQEINIRGSQIRHYIKRYRFSWERFHPDRELPKGDWLQHYDDEAISPVFTERRSSSRWVSSRGFSLRSPRTLPPPPPDDDHWKHKIIASPDGWSVTLSVCWWGKHRFDARIMAEDTPYYFDRSIAEVLDLSDADRLRIDDWVRRVRGSEWDENHGQKAKAEQEADRQREAGSRARRSEVLRQHCAESRSRQSLRVGIRLSAEAHPAAFKLTD